MNDAALKSHTQKTQDIVVDEVFPHAPETLWRALTSGDLVGRWLHNERQGLICIHLALANRVEMRQIHYFAPNRSQALFGRSDGFLHSNLLIPVRTRQCRHRLVVLKFVFSIAYSSARLHRNPTHIGFPRRKRRSLLGE